MTAQEHRLDLVHAFDVTEDEIKACRYLYETSTEYNERYVALRLKYPDYMNSDSEDYDKFRTQQYDIFYNHDYWLLLHRTIQILEPKFQFGVTGEVDKEVSEVCLYYMENEREYPGIEALGIVQVMTVCGIYDTNYPYVLDAQDDFTEFDVFWRDDYRVPTYKKYNHRCEYMQPLIDDNVDYTKRVEVSHYEGDEQPSPAVFVRLAIKILRQFYAFANIEKELPIVPESDDEEIWKRFAN